MNARHPLAWFRRAERTGQVAALAGLVLVAVVCARVPWIGEDAHITLRTVDNLVHGHGLRWNVDERVQTFTHPLWLLLLTALHALTGEMDFTVVALGLASTWLAFVALARATRSTALTLVLLALVLGSGSLLTFATSGFENPLTHCLLSCFALTLARPANETGQPAWSRLSFLAALALLTRLDTAVLFLPVFGVLLLGSRPGVRAWRGLLLGGLPLAAWLAFSLVYYGFLVPNTAPAKLSAHVSLQSYVVTGARDLAALFHADRGSGLILLLGLASGVLSLLRYVRDREDRRARGLAALFLGLLLLGAYTIRVGGDFVVGRFWTTHLWVALILLALNAGDVGRWWASRAPARRAGVVVAAFVLLGAFDLAFSRLLAPRLFGPAAIRPYWREELRLRPMARRELHLDLGWTTTPVAAAWQKRGELARQRAGQGQRVLVTGTIGFTGLAAGPEVVVLDRLALGDPLLARLAPHARTLVTAGHLERRLPRGYVHARETGSLERLEPEMRAYYEALRLVTSGPLFSAARFRAILALHTGALSPPRDYEPESEDVLKRVSGRD